MSAKMITISIGSNFTIDENNSGNLEDVWGVAAYMHENDGITKPGVVQFQPDPYAAGLGSLVVNYNTNEFPGIGKAIVDVLLAYRAYYRDFEHALARKLWRELSKRLPEDVQASKAAACADVVEEAIKEVKEEIK